MARNNEKIRKRIVDAEQAADIAVAAVRAESQVGSELSSAVTSLHDWARQAKQSVDGSEGEFKDVATLRGLIAAAEEAADQAMEEAATDAGVSKATKKALKQAHDAIKKAKDQF
jgi:hypothetical protein